jgi:hypothetical protein
MQQAEEQKYTIHFEQLPLQGFEHNKSFLAEDIVRQSILNTAALGSAPSNVVFATDDNPQLQKGSSAPSVQADYSSGQNSSVSAAPCENVEKFPGERAALLEYMACICRGPPEQAPIIYHGKPFDFDLMDVFDLSNLSISKMAITNRIEIEVGKWDRYVLDFITIYRSEMRGDLYKFFLIAIREISTQEYIPGKLIHVYLAPSVIGYKVFHYRGVMYARPMGVISPFIYNGEHFVIDTPIPLNFLTVDRFSSPETLLAYNDGKILRIGDIDCLFSGKKRDENSYELVVEADLNIPLERVRNVFVDFNAKIWVFTKPFGITILDSDLRVLVRAFPEFIDAGTPYIYKDQEDRILVAFPNVNVKRKYELSLVPNQ